MLFGQARQARFQRGEPRELARESKTEDPKKKNARVGFRLVLSLCLRTRTPLSTPSSITSSRSARLWSRWRSGRWVRAGPWWPEPLA